MPNRPAPYLMRDWKGVARGYDSLVFNINLSGTYLPLVWFNTSPINYPGHNSFGLHTVVGTTVPASAEAINCIPAVVGAALTGIDKSNQNGYNWVLMSEEWFNKRPSQNVYKNHPVDDGGEDWWYETMPNVFFYQLNNLYPGTGDFNYQFASVADRWALASQAMGGSATPWQIPNMNHRGWYLQTMTPYDAGVREPEAAGAIGWLLYQAYVKTGSARYRIGAEWAMEFLDILPTNPSYELQLPYGTYLAARMNAELGTTYDVEKMVNWCFNVGPLRSWGAVVGTWGSYDCSGLIGEINGVNDYAFTMNTFEQVGALVPLVRYDPRFARAVGKWVLNAANASRLFYPNYLPDNHQDSRAWSRQYDSNSVIAHEAMRQFNGGTSPFATGDAISGGWGQTNLSLYSSSHAGILGGIIDTTEVPMILTLDVLKTDYYHAPAYPSYLLFNPYDSVKTVSIDAGSGTHDLYDAVSRSFVLTGVSGMSPLPLQPNSAALVVIAPAGGTVTYDFDKMLIDGIIVDYHSSHFTGNYPPRIKAFAADHTTLTRGDSIRIYCTAVDRDGDTVGFSWRASGGTIHGAGRFVTWIAPDSVGSDTVTCTAADGRGGLDSARIVLTVALFINHPPVISRIVAAPRKIDLGTSSQLTCLASDPDTNTLTYNWTAPAGTVTGSGAGASWSAPSIAGNYYVYCTVDDGHGGQAFDSVGIEVRDFSVVQSGEMVAYYPFDGNANDSSGFNNNGTVNGAVPANDRNGSPGRAYSFNGTTNSVQVANSTSLNFQQAVTVNFWMKIGALFSREQYPISHGNWQNRWKVSISNNRLRWTVKTTVGTKDLDSETGLTIGTWYNVTVLYNGSDYEIYLNGDLDAFSSWSGTILTTAIDLTIGQVLPTDQGYNFQGVLDDIRIYNHALSVAQIQGLASGLSAVEDLRSQLLPREYSLSQNYPNPFNPETHIRFSIPSVAGRDLNRVSLKVYDVTGREVATLVNGVKSPGSYIARWDASLRSSGVYFVQLSAPAFQLTRKILLLR
ncbi:MAG TPA: LamG-like jellyroll fold domain-containing protein [Bacteroidota bacterium]|nr:LamG-like jellyroll fold domain-containing protein [Bacteroidota bacterium]